MDVKYLFTTLAVFCMLNVNNCVSATRLESETPIDYFKIIRNYNRIMQILYVSRSALNVSSECATQWNFLFDALTKEEPDQWALKMLDATSKVQSGILAGNIYNLGDYDECQSIYHVPMSNGTSNGTLLEKEQETISGKYCLGTIKSELQGVTTDKLSLYWAMCVPEKCSANDLNAILQIVNVSITFEEPFCHAKSEDPKITSGDVALIVCFSMILLFMIASSSYDVYLNYTGKETSHPAFVAFSVIRNGKKLFLIGQNNKDQLDCLDGLRAISMMWLILLHSAFYALYILVGLARMTDLEDFFHNNWTMYIRGSTVAVDSFFLMSGIVMMYVHMKGNSKLKLFQYYLHRYLRLTPALAAIIAVNATVLKHMGGGPFWYVNHNNLHNNCVTYWWSALLYIQNYVNPNDLCVGQSWYLSVDTQLFLISPLILIPIKKRPKATLIMAALAALISISYAFGIAWIYELVDFNTANKSADQKKGFMKYYYTVTFARASPWFFGLIVGYFINKVKNDKLPFKINRVFNIILWISSLSVMLTCVFYDKFYDDYNRMAMSSYLAFVRPAWSIALSWIIFACLTGYGGPVNAFLSLPVFKIVSRLTYSMYITHLTIIWVRAFSTKHAAEFGSSALMYNFWSTFALVFIVSTVWTLAFESPILILGNLLLKPKRSQAPTLPKGKDTPTAITRF